jgi:hypothetical protein
LKWGEELIGHRRMKGGDPKGFNDTSDEDSDEDEESENDFEEEDDGSSEDEFED